MTTRFNDTFRYLLTEYNLPEDFSFSVDIPNEVQQILDSKILRTELGITLEYFNTLYIPTESWQNKSIIEDAENHFHVDWFVDRSDNKQAFMLGLKVITMLAYKFQNEKVVGVTLSFSFQTPELGKKWENANIINEEGEEVLISDRLSFFTNRDNEEIISDDFFNNPFWAILTIDL